MINDKLIYFVLAGDIGFYRDFNDAIKASNQNMNNIIKLRRYDYHIQLERELYKLATIRDDINFLALEPYIGSKALDIQKVNNNAYFTVAYYSRIINIDSFKYGFILFNSGNMYEYINPNTKGFRGKDGDLSALMKLKELENLYKFRGVIRTSAPIEEEVLNYLPNWKYEFHHPKNYELPLKSLNNVLNGKQRLMETVLL